MPDSNEIRDPKTWAAYDSYCEWLSLPRHYATVPREKLVGFGLPEHLIELASISTKKQFGDKFLIEPGMLLSWDKLPDLQEKVKKNWKQWAKHLTPGVMGKFHEKLMEEADPARMKIWLQTIEDEGKEDSTINLSIGIDNIRKSMQEDMEIDNGKK
jgi:hypothetical protein